MSGHVAYIRTQEMHTKQLTGEATVLEYMHNHILDLQIISVSVKKNRRP